MTRSIAVLLLACGCGWLPPDSPPKPQTRGDLDAAALEHVWVIQNHILGGNASLSEHEAFELHGRKVLISATEVQTPWHGSCDDPKRDRRDRSLSEVVSAGDLAGDARGVAKRFGLAERVTEYTFTCAATVHQIPPFVLDVSGDSAMTCWAGVCYLLTH